MAFREEWCEELRHRDRGPNHDNHHAHEPFPQIHLVCLHQPERGQKHECRNEECRQSEALLDEEVGRVGSQRAAAVGECVVSVHQFAFANRLNEALVGGSRREKRDERQREVNCNAEKQRSNEEGQFFVVDEALEPNGFKERSMMLFSILLFFLCHIAHVLLFSVQK